VIAILNAADPDGWKKYPLTPRTESFVAKIPFNVTGANSRTPRATSVESLAGQSMYSADPRVNASVKGTEMQAFARKEVIISGGVFNSPQLLKISGIGPKVELESFNIPRDRRSTRHWVEPSRQHGERIEYKSSRELYCFSTSLHVRVYI
jgi:choline dehydrogenase